MMPWKEILINNLTYMYTLMNNLRCIVSDIRFLCLWRTRLHLEAAVEERITVCDDPSPDLVEHSRRSFVGPRTVEWPMPKINMS